MIKPGALVMGVLMAAVSAGTYYGLEFLPQGLLPEPLGRAPPPEPPKPAGEEAFVESPGMASAAGHVETLAKSGVEEPLTEQDLAEEPPPPAEQPAAAQAEAEPATEPEPAPAAAAEPEPAPEAKPEPAPAPKPKAAPKQPTTMAKAESSSAPASESAPASTKAKPPEADVIKPWWPNPDKMPANQLKLQYAGQVQGQQAIALLFSAPLNIDSLRQHARIRTSDGQPVDGQWELGKNPRLAVFRGVKPGRYTVILQPAIADAKGFMLGTTLKGPVYIQEP